MPHAIWTGSVSFGLVNIPVGLFSATADHTIHFRQFAAGTSDRVRNLRVNERTGKEVAYADVVKGYDLGGDEYVIVEPQELQAISPKRSTNIEISDFVDLSEVDPVYFRSSYYLGPASPAAAKAYGLLHRAMSETGKVGVSTFVMRGKEYLCIVRADRDALMLQTMHFADEIRDPKEVLDSMDDLEEPTKRELNMAAQLVESLSARWQPDAYRDTYRDDVEALVERKRKGQSLVTNVADLEDDLAPVVDLMSALEASVEGATRGGRSRRSSSSASKDGASPGSKRGNERATAKAAGTPQRSKPGQAKPAPRKTAPRKTAPRKRAS